MPLIFTPLDTGKYVARANLVLKTLEGTNLNSIDILVRESIQNSLDAATADNQEVTVDFSISESSINEICSIFGLDSKRLTGKKYKPDSKCKVLTIRDTGTTGLTGDFNDENSKIYKLVADIGRANSNKGAGGSWGLGKTIYYHMGRGIVGFYSQTSTKSSRLTSRLAFGYIEDEKRPKKDRLITTTETGIAWWGEADGAPIANKMTMKPILKTLGVSPFQKNETGTCIVIPFFNETNDLLPRSEEGALLPWETDEADYIKLAIQRWYSNRLIKTQGKPTLRAYVNGQPLDKVEPVFKQMQSLRKLVDNFKSHETIKLKGDLKLSPSPKEQFGWKVDKDTSFAPAAYLKGIYLNTTLQDDATGRQTPVGWIAARRLSSDDLKMRIPDNLPSPHKYIFGSSEKCDEKLPIVAMARSPQMIVAYNTDQWRTGLSLEVDGEYLIALFALNSHARLLDGTQLEEYIRGIENATHTDWIDSKIGSAHREIPTKIKTKVVNALKNAFFNTTEIMEDQPRAERIRAQLGSTLLPSEFGTAGTKCPPRKSANSTKAPSIRQSQPTLHIDQTEYTNEGIRLSLRIYNAKSERLKITIEADAGAGNTMTSTAWNSEIQSPRFPFILSEFKAAGIRTIKGKGKPPAFKQVDKKCSISLSDDSCELILNEGHHQELQSELTLKTHNQLVNPVIKLATVEV